MTTLYVANCTKQHHTFIYRRPESSATIKHEIPAGAQERIASNVSISEIENIISQHRRYGLIPETEAANGKVFVGLCYSTDKPVKLNNMHVAFELNDIILTERSRATLATTAASIQSNLDSHLVAARNPARTTHLEVEVSEQVKPGNQQTLNEGVEVVKDGTAPRRRASKH